MKYNIILHITTACNYNCSYCDVIKDGKSLSRDIYKELISFFKKNKSSIETLKFFGGEPLIAYKDIESICDEIDIWLNYQIVTNTTLLNESIGLYFQKFFKILFFSIDTEHDFDYEKIDLFLKKYSLQEKIYFNLIISPGYEKESEIQFQKLYSMGYRGFNILPVYFTKPWTNENLSQLSLVMKWILDISFRDPSVKLYGFQENQGYDISLVNHSLFIDIDGSIYYSDMVSTFSGKSIRQNLFLWHIRTFNMRAIKESQIFQCKKIISNLEKSLYSKMQWQNQLHKLMDYFSTYLNRLHDISK